MAEIRRQLDQEFSMKRDQALREADYRKKEAYEKIPCLSALDAEITLAGIRYAKAVLSDEARAVNANDLSEHINRLNHKKEALLLAHGYSADYLSPVFSCSFCEDRGYVTDPSGGSKPCSCYRRLYLERLYAVSNLLDDGQTGFGFFNSSFFPDTPDEKKYQLQVSPREQMEFIRRRCIQFVGSFAEKETQNLYFFGPTGTGKTFMAKSIGLELLKMGFSVLYLSAPILFSIIHQHRISEPENQDSQNAYKSLITVNLLILDDLGTEPGSDARYAELLTLLEMRKAQGKTHTAKTIVSSNLGLKKLFQEYNERIASRIVGEFETLQFIGEDIRLLKKLSGADITQKPGA